MERLCDLEKDYYCDDISDGANATDSSEEDVEQMLEDFTMGSIGQSSTNFQRVATKSLVDKKNVDESSDFEAEMDEQLSSSFESHRNDWLAKMGRPEHEKSAAQVAPMLGFYKSGPCTSKILKKQSKPKSELNDEGRECNAVDSDEEFYDQEKSTLQGCDLTNDELLYDPDSDDDNQLWVNNKRRIYAKNTKNLDLSKSDAILNCPACMSVLCYDCQRIQDDMKLLIHNFLASKFLKGVSTGYPLKLVATQIDVAGDEPAADSSATSDDDEAANDAEFVKRTMPKVDYAVLKSTADSIGHGEGLPDSLDDSWAENGDLLKSLRKILLKVDVVEGYLECPETGRRFPIKNGIPNMLANEDEVA